MASGVSPIPILIYMLFVVAAQTGIDFYFSRPYLPGDLRRRVGILAIANVVALTATTLLIRLIIPLHTAFLLFARGRGFMAIAMLLLIVEYFVWAFLYALLRGYIVREWGMSDEIREKHQAWWSYVLVGSIASLLLMGPLYVIFNLVLPLMIGAAEVFEQS